jgi:hypothetical protein
MKNAHAAALTGTLLFRKGGATPDEFLASHSDELLGRSIVLKPKLPRERDPNAPIRVSMRLDRVRRQHLQLAAAKLGISVQELLISALDHYLRSEVPTRLADPCCCLKTPARPEPV